MSKQAGLKNAPFPDIAELKRVEKALRKAYDELDMRVEERTAEFAEINEKLRIEITERKQVEHDLSERMKELRCLYNMAIIDETPGITLNEVYQEVVNLLPSSWQYPEITWAKITIGGTEFKTENYAETEWKLSSNIKVHGVKIGAVHVGYLEARPELGETPFLKEERILLDTVAERLGKITRSMQAEELYQTLATSSPVGVYIVQDGKFKFVNSQFQKHLGFTEDELLDMDPMKLIHPEDRERVTKNVEEMLKGNRLLPYDFRASTKSGETVWAIETVTSINYKGKRAILGNFMDITERKRMEEELKESEKRYRNLLEAVPIGISVTTPEGNNIELNSTMWKMLGFSSKDEMLKVQAASTYYNPEDRERFIELQKKKSRVKGLDVQYKRRDGMTFWGSLTSVRRETADGKTQFVNAVEDITKRKRMERELQEKNEQLDSQNEELQSQTEELMAQQQELIGKTGEVEKANQLKSSFLANMSHELRTPLNVIIGFSQLMMDEMPGRINDEQRQCLSDMLESSQHLLNLVNEVLDLSKIESGRTELNLENIELTEVIESLDKTMMPVLTPRKQSLDIEIEKGLPMVHADRAKVEQVLLNLMNNASKYAPDRGKLKIEAVREDNWCQVSVIDNGNGISKEDQERIFEPFCQLGNYVGREKSGVGLGLALVRQIVDRYGGRIWVESEYGKGSRFTFTLPLAITD